jgi:CYTH domain-containing protein/predicted ATPase
MGDPDKISFAMSEHIPQIVLTGGPCGGKTTALAYLNEKLSDLGYRVFIVPEAATMLITGGVNDIADIIENKPEKHYGFQKELVKTQGRLRERFLSLARIFPDEKCVILLDRAEMDAMAYMGRESFARLMKEVDQSVEEIRDSYDAVVHMVTAADGAEEAYSHENNPARYETPEKAVENDRKVQNAWVGHPKLKIIDNSTDFENKLKRTNQVIMHVLGLPVPLEIERKYLLASPPDLQDEAFANAQIIDLQQMYLLTPDVQETRLRKRSQAGKSTFYRTQKFSITSTTRSETENVITEEEYLNLQSLRDPSRRILNKKRCCFVFENQYFELDMIPGSPPLYLLEIELTEENDKLTLPPFLNIEREVTGEKEYSNSYLALFPE